MRATDNPACAWSHWPAPAKLNLFLRILGQRSDGYHTLQTVFRLLDWGDTIHLQLRDDGQVHRIGAPLAGLSEADDLAVRAAKLLQTAANCTHGVNIRIDKRIPAGAGFGGGSSDAATVLVALNQLWGVDWNEEQLAALALQLGADVPVFVRGRNAWAEGVGEQLTPLELPPAAYVLAAPDAHIATAALFAAPELARNAIPATPENVLSGNVLDNAFEPLARQSTPPVEAVWQALSAIGQPRLTGTGGGCFVEFATRVAAESAALRLPPGIRAWVADGAAQSPLLDALNLYIHNQPQH